MKTNQDDGEKIFSEVACLTGDDMPESVSVQLHPDLPPGKPSLHEHEWPQKTVPYPIARAMEFCLENCRIAQYSKEPIGPEDSIRQKCRFPLHCSIVLRADK